MLQIYKEVEKFPPFTFSMRREWASALSYIHKSQKLAGDILSRDEAGGRRTKSSERPPSGAKGTRTFLNEKPRQQYIAFLPRILSHKFHLPEESRVVIA